MYGARENLDRLGGVKEEMPKLSEKFSGFSLCIRVKRAVKFNSHRTRTAQGITGSDMPERVHRVRKTVFSPSARSIFFALPRSPLVSPGMRLQCV